ncbi:endonuclease/exonuclease/phosphatase (EEP) superfamily protein YafD [Palleronia aestuarii]|uniref:Endonuclease/exonuclease/phosphatase (EEP) superfamily protein YafD n=1 Tax=Palleronia aestuarii TaxID=568105 RepID=A0A2W7MU09_9RHOB|nr:endonuclease/exonuclease/phosphatase family protein [Palleronia aestuarii]PZX09647.1 endonuclease/exonuclease/phosphatase (EEP) superfamily protein YafD [Palleronia aestuarii]
MSQKTVAATLLRGLLWIAAISIALLTFITLWDTNLWWVRALDFPRLQIAIAAGLVTLLGLLLRGAGRLAVLSLTLASGGYQLYRILPYTIAYPPEMRLAPDGPDALRLFAANVLMENDRHDLVLEQVSRFDPDILLLMETDRAWVDALEPVLKRYPTIVREPRDNHYGMVFATRLEAREARIVYLTEDDTPSLFAELRGPGGMPFRFVGLHPRPPVPGQSTADRDAQIYYAARFASGEKLPLVVMGDFNDVAWSDTSQMFKHVGGYLDPRIGRGFFASFDAETALVQFPIDQLYVTEDVAVVSIEQLPYVGSDHFPMAATIRLDADLAAGLNDRPEPLGEKERERIEATVNEMRASLGHDLPN